MTATAAVSDIRDARGRFRPGRSGNPAGKPRGCRNWSTRLMAVLEEADFEAFARQLMAAAKDGNMTALRMMFDRLDPKPRGRWVEVIAEGSLVERCRAVFDAACGGEITPSEAVELSRVLESERRLVVHEDKRAAASPPESDLNLLAATARAAPASSAPGSDGASPRAEAAGDAPPEIDLNLLEATLARAAPTVHRAWRQSQSAARP
jgi:hypothetical protein